MSCRKNVERADVISVRFVPALDTGEKRLRLAILGRDMAAAWARVRDQARHAAVLPPGRKNGPHMGGRAIQEEVRRAPSAQGTSTVVFAQTIGKREKQDRERHLGRAKRWGSASSGNC
jgi:hypothetical protein